MTPGAGAAGDPSPSPDEAGRINIEERSPGARIPTRAESGVSLRALLIGVAAVIAVCVIVPRAELIDQVQIGYLQFPAVAIGMLVFLLLGSSYFRTLNRRLGLTSQEFLTIYSMMVLASMISSRGLMQKLIPALVTPNYFADPSNNWQTIYWPHFKQWMMPWRLHGGLQQYVAKAFFEGLRFGAKIPWRPWVLPMFAWIVLALLFFTAFLCLAALLRRQWIDNEKLSFPLVQLPLEMARRDGQSGLFNNRLTWIGFAIPAAIFSINGLHNFFPFVPDITTTVNLNQYFTTRPWSDIEYTAIYVSFAGIGFFYFLPTELIFSLWFFYVLTRVQDVFASSLGLTMDAMPMYPTHLFIGYQVIGAYFVLTGYFLATARPHVRTIMNAVIGGRGAQAVDDSGELIPYRIAFWGLVLSLAGAVVWWWIAGMAVWLAVFEIVIFVFIIALVLARSTSEAGMLMTETSFRPINVYEMFGSRSNLGAQNLTMLALMDTIFLRDQRGLLLGGFMDGLKLAEGVNIRRRSFLKVFVLAILVAIIVASYIQIRVPYTYHGGGLNLYGYVYQGNNEWGLQDYATAVAGAPQPYDWRRPVFFLVGVAITLFLSIMRLNFSGWPLHPLGYALSASWTMVVFWFPALIAWIVKGLIQRYGGMKVYTQFRPFFLGLILGEFSIALLWTCVSAVTHVPPPSFPWA